MLQALVHCAIQIGYKRDDHVRAILAPKIREHLHLLRVIEANDALHQRQKIIGARRPTPSQHAVIQVLQPDSGNFAEHIERIQQLLKIDETDLPGAVLLLADGFECGCRASMTAACIEEHEIKLVRSQSPLSHVRLSGGKHASKRRPCDRLSTG